MLSKNGYIWIAKAIRGSDAPAGSGTSAHVGHVLARLQAMSAEVPEPAGASDQKSDLGATIYPFKLSYPQIYMNFCDLVVYPNRGYCRNEPLLNFHKYYVKSTYLMLNYRVSCFDEIFFNC